MYPNQGFQNSKVQQATALLNVTFEKPQPYLYGCVLEPQCGRSMLHVDLYLSNEKRSWVFNIGDSKSNDGTGNDGSTQENDAELVGKNENMTLIRSDKCNNLKKVFANSLCSGVTHVRLYISNLHIRIQNNKGMDARICKWCLFALNDQSDSEGQKNDYIYIGLNRVIRYYWKRGAGVCKTKIKWACPCSTDDFK